MMKGVIEGGCGGMISVLGYGLLTMEDLCAGPVLTVCGLDRKWPG